ncbi:MAG: hypothetical protein II134_04965 [Lachnospiraceae bacterium]|nr:hypothetical protein [Lachnospiraceae bacterium]
MKALKTILALALVGLIVYFVLTLIMPKIAFKQKKAIIDSYKIAKTETDSDDTYRVRMDMSKGTWEGLEYELERVGFEKTEPAKLWNASPDKTLFTNNEIKTVVKEYIRKTSQGVPITKKYFVEYFAVMKDEAGFHIYFETRMRDSEFEPLGNN